MTMLFSPRKKYYYSVPIAIIQGSYTINFISLTEEFEGKKDEWVWLVHQDVLTLINKNGGFKKTYTKMQ